MALKGLPEPVRTVAVETGARAEDRSAPSEPPIERARRRPGRGVRRPRGPRLVGRDLELEALEDELQVAAAGEFRCVLLTAEAGVGKTRLAAELAARHGEDVVVLSARAHPMGETAAFGLWAEALDGYLRSLEPREVSRLCGGLLDDLAGLLRSVAAVRGSVPDRPAPRTSLLEGIAVVINNLCRVRPVLVLLDDLHQSDASSWETLDYLARGLEAEPVLVVMGARPADLSGQQVAVRMLSGLEQDGFLRRLPLTSLSPVRIGELAGEILHSPPPPALITWLSERSGGNPLFALGLLRALVDEGADLKHPELRRIPENLAERFQGVLATFSEPALAMIEVLSVLGHPATRDQLAALADRSPEQVTGVIDELLRSRAVIEEEDAGEIRYGFLHPLIRETAYQTLGATRRRALHRMIGRALLGTGAVAEAAPHFARSAVVGDDEAIAALLEGIRRAEEREAYRESLALLSGLVDILPSGDDRWLQAADALAWQADWVNDRGRGDRLAIAAIRAMREIDAVLESSPDDRRRADVKLRLSSFLIYSAGELEDGLRTAAEAETLYRAAGDDSGACLASITQSASHLLQGRVAFAGEQVEALLSTPAVVANEMLATRVRGVCGLAWFYSGCLRPRRSEPAPQPRRSASPAPGIPRDTVPVRALNVVRLSGPDWRGQNGGRTRQGGEPDVARCPGPGDGDFCPLVGGGSHHGAAAGRGGPRVESRRLEPPPGPGYRLRRHGSDGSRSARYRPAVRRPRLSGVRRPGLCARPRCLPPRPQRSDGAGGQHEGSPRGP